MSLPDNVARGIEYHLAAIGNYFIIDSKITLLVRPPTGPDLDSDLVMTTDTLPEIIGALERRMKTPLISAFIQSC